MYLVLKSKTIHETTVKYMKANRIEKGFNQTNEREGFKFLPPLSPSSSSLAVDDGSWYVVRVLVLVFHSARRRHCSSSTRPVS